METRHGRGHSLVEILIVVAIVLILASLILWAFIKIRKIVKGFQPASIQSVEPGVRLAWRPDGPNATCGGRLRFAKA